MVRHLHHHTATWEPLHRVYHPSPSRPACPQVSRPHQSQQISRLGSTPDLLPWHRPRDSVAAQATSLQRRQVSRLGRRRVRRASGPWVIIIRKVLVSEDQGGRGLLHRPGSEHHHQPDLEGHLMDCPRRLVSCLRPWRLLLGLVSLHRVRRLLDLVVAECRSRGTGTQALLLQVTTWKHCYGRVNIFA